MDQKAVFDLIADNSVIGVAGSAAFVLLYKIWRILQSDRKEDNLDAAEREFREEMRKDLKELRDQLKRCEIDKDALYKKIDKLNRILNLIQSTIHHCPKGSEIVCPISNLTGIFNND